MPIRSLHLKKMISLQCFTDKKQSLLISYYMYVCLKPYPQSFESFVCLFYGKKSFGLISVSRINTIIMQNTCFGFV